MSKGLSIKSITLAVFLFASVNLVWQFYRMHLESVRLQRAYEQYGLIVCTMGPARDEVTRVYIEFLLILAVVGSWVKGFKRTLLSVAGLAGSAIFYVLWWQYYFKLAEISESEIVFARHLVYLYRANYLDICIAVSIGALILLHIHHAVLSLFVPQATSGSE